MLVRSLEGKSVTVTGVYVKHGGKNNSRFLLDNVVFKHDGSLFRDHVWLPICDASTRVNWLKGTRYELTATVYHYQRQGYYDKNRRRYVPMSWQLGLKAPWKIRVAD